MLAQYISCCLNECNTGNLKQPQCANPNIVLLLTHYFEHLLIIGSGQALIKILEDIVNAIVGGSVGLWDWVRVEVLGPIKCDMPVWVAVAGSPAI